MRRPTCLSSHTLRQSISIISFISHVIVSVLFASYSTLLQLSNDIRYAQVRVWEGGETRISTGVARFLAATVYLGAR